MEIEELKFELATPDEQKIGWTYSYEMLDRLNNDCAAFGYRPGMEEIEAVLKVLASHGILPVPNAKLTGTPGTEE